MSEYVSKSKAKHRREGPHPQWARRAHVFRMWRGDPGQELSAELKAWRNVGPELAAWAKAGGLKIAKRMHGGKRSQPGGTPEQVETAKAVAAHAGNADAPRWVVLAFAAHSAHMQPRDVVEFCRLAKVPTSRPPPETPPESHHGHETTSRDSAHLRTDRNHTASETKP